MLLGQYNHTLDNKNRLILPSKIRNEFSSEVYITLDFDNCLSLYSKEEFEKKSQTFIQLNSFSTAARSLQRVFFANSQILNIDSASRINLPSFLLEKVGITKDVILIGMNNHLEIWDKETFFNNELENESNYQTNAEKLIGDKSND